MVDAPDADALADEHGHRHGENADAAEGDQEAEKPAERRLLA
jgi:hypothetical protein